jgi:hypothetical protein
VGRLAIGARELFIKTVTSLLDMFLEDDSGSLVYDTAELTLTAGLLLDMRTYLFSCFSVF